MWDLCGLRHPFYLNEEGSLEDFQLQALKARVRVRVTVRARVQTALALPSSFLVVCFRDSAVDNRPNLQRRQFSRALEVEEIPSGVGDETQFGRRVACTCHTPS